MSGTLGPNGRLDPQQGVIWTFVGKKKSGKSVLAMLVFMSYPGDKIVIDVAGDDGPVGPDVITIVGTIGDGSLPDAWPEWLRRYTDDGGPLPMTLRYVPDAGSPTFLDDMDHIVGLAMSHGECCILVHEMQVLAPANKTRKHTRRLLNHNRHNGATTALFCGPRSQGIDLLILAQADLLSIFELQNKSDRDRIAESIGWNKPELDDAVEALGPHENLRFDANEPKPEDDQPDMRLVHCPALPLDIVKKVLRYADPEGVLKK